MDHYLYWYGLGSIWVQEQRRKLGWAGGKGRIKRQIKYTIEYVNMQLTSNAGAYNDGFLDAILDSVN